MNSPCFLHWAGGKWKLAPKILSKIPQGTTSYCEPFLGGGAVLLSHELKSVANEINEEIYNLWSVVKHNPEALVNELDWYIQNFSEDFFYKTRRTIPVDCTHQAARTLFLNKTCFNGLYRQNSKGEFNVPFCKKDSCPSVYEKNRILRASDRLKNVTLNCMDFEPIIDQTKSGDFIYCDPPYHTETGFKTYTKHGFSEKDHVRLVDALQRAKQRGCNVLLSNAPTPFILDLLKNWNIEHVSRSGSINSDPTRRGRVGEIMASL